ncbi:MAG TPA: penicillin-binding protein 2 [Gemmatimonadales bacterium]|jgi:penicillin-binding protein 2
MTWYHPHEVARRADQARWAVWIVAAALIISFFRLQILSAGRYKLQSEENRLRPVPIPAPRGLILDRNGNVLAENVPGYSIGLLAPTADSLRATLQRIAPIVGLDSAQIRGIVRGARRTPYEPAMIRRDAPFDLVSALEERRALIPGLVIQSEPRRRYPYGPISAHAVGYVGPIEDRELASEKYQDAHPGALVGRDGLEKQYDLTLRGKDGVRFVEVDALGRTVRESEGETGLPPEQGQTVTTSIDIELQRYVAQAFPAGRRGAVVAMDPASGQVLALYSSPSYDPNGFIGGFDPITWKAISESDDRPLFNRATQARYPPASPWKLLVAAIALKRGVATWDTHMPYPCTGGFQYYNRYFRCWKADGHGDLTLGDAIANSCDVYFYQLGRILGLENLLHDAGELGLHDRSGIDLPNEQAPEFPSSTAYYDRLYGPRNWTRGVVLNLAIGQGENAQTLVNMVHFYAMLASENGTAPAPRLVGSAAGGPVRDLGLSAEDLLGLRQALVKVVEQGTARGARIADLHIAGKTGTAQNPHGPNHGWFIGFAPADHPRIVVGAIEEFAGEGPVVAPIVTRIIARYLMGPDAVPTSASEFQLTLPPDSAPAPILIRPGPDSVRGRGRDTTRHEPPREHGNSPAR